MANDKVSHLQYDHLVFKEHLSYFKLFLASQDAQEVKLVSVWVSQWVSQSALADFTDVTLVSEDTFWRLDWCDSGEWWYLKKTWFMWLWWVMIPKEDLTDVTLVCEDAF